MSEQVRLLNTEEIYDVTLDARVVALRWDIIPWTLVLDLDIPLYEDSRDKMRRAWLCFPGFSEITWPFEEARLPTGCWLTSPLEITPVSEMFQEICFVALLPRFDDENNMKDSPSADIVIRAMKVVAAVSEAYCVPGEYGLSYQARIALASDESFLAVVAPQVN